MPSNWEYVLFVYISTWMILLGYMSWLWRTYRKLRGEITPRSDSKEEGA